MTRRPKTTTLRTHGRTGAIVVLLTLGVFGAGWGAAAASGAPAHHSTHTTTSSTTTTTLPACGATRDPFDPTNAHPPAGSPAVC